jgi:hypothetical protein
VFNGTEPTYDVPTPPGVDPTGDYYVQVGRRDNSANGDPWLHTVNIVDLQHIVYLHGADSMPIQLDTPLDVTEHGVHYEFDMDFPGPVRTRHAIVGTNVVAASIWDREDGTLVWAWMMPMLAEPNGQSRAFRVGLMRKVTGDAAEQASVDAWFTNMLEGGEKIRQEDEDLVGTIRPRPRNLLPGPDDYLRRTMAWLRDHPRTDPAADYR